MACACTSNRAKANNVVIKRTPVRRANPNKKNGGIRRIIRRELI